VDQESYESSDGVSFPFEFLTPVAVPKGMAITIHDEKSKRVVRGMSMGLEHVDNQDVTRIRVLGCVQLAQSAKEESDGGASEGAVGR